MEWTQISQIIFDIIAMLGVIFGVYNFYLKNRERDGGKVSSLKEGELSLNSRIDLFKSELSGEIKNLATSLGGEIKALNTEFTSIKLNHLHTIEEKQKSLEGQVNQTNVAIAQLTTIIDERIPKKIKK